MGKMLGGGVESVVMSYYRHIDRERVQFDFIVDSDSTLVPREEIEELGGRVIAVPPYQRVFRYYGALRELFCRRGWLIVHSHINTLSVFPLRAASGAGVPVRIAHSHSTMGRGELLRNAAKAALRTQANRYPTHRLACSKRAGEWLFGKNADFEVLHNAIELDRFFFNAEVRSKARADLGLVGDTFAVGHVGRFMPQKNHRFLIEVFAELVKLRPDSVLLCVGDGDTMALAERLVDKYGVADKVIFLGQRGDAWRFYHAFDAFALPSLYEGLGIAAIEAQAAGLPCFLSSVITREVDVTETVRFLDVEAPRRWASELAELQVGQERSVERAAFYCYDIETAANELVNTYSNYLCTIA